MKTLKILLFVSFIILFTTLSFAIDNDHKPYHKFVVVLDAGHGGHDPGNLGNGFKEKDIALKIVLDIGKELEKNPNIKVVYTRKTDVFVDLFERGKIANKANADLFVSVHCNSHNSSAHGTETFVLGTHRNQTNFEVAKKENSVIFLENDYESKYAGFDPNSPESVIGLTLAQEEYLDQSIRLAKAIQNNFTTTLKRTDRGVKQAGFIVLHQTVMPSVLVETGFLTYRDEGRYLNSQKGQKEIASSIADAIIEYKKSLDQNVGEDIFEEEEAQQEAISHATADESNIIFRVQIAAGSRKIETKPYNFKTLEDISREQEGNLYKYYYGSTHSYDEVTKLEEIAKSKGYKSSFIVAFKDGKRISLADALKTSAN
ncbi:N-acetylmuramoyl-L-alanine amidase [Yeosuana aromativorans]|uniref:N-acetylmuramoyl-L-alanine amidase n=1 Tax=Yeosuana aromativorans TaxID=288019 RepID=A0A8J3FHC2_9FLAO|nr:N-acetylmuramoyl-L-alanine amidase [Yeosuana aromativorans]GGK28145.1 N-acetylmuramoyl-L-alanine amidase [Yeosuana aromativorans]